MPKRQLIITKAVDGESSSGLEPLGDRDDVYRKLRDFNTSPDVEGGEFLYGPGLTVQAPMTGSDEINQLLLVMLDEEFAWPVVSRMCAETGWQLIDPDSGRTLTF